MYQPGQAWRTREDIALLHDSFDDLVDAQGARLFSLAYLILQDGAAAEDAVQETLIKAWRSTSRLNSPERIDAWMRQILLNACRDQFRQLKRRQRAEAAIVLEDRTVDDNGRVERHDEIVAAMRRLSREHREVIVLRYYADLSAKAIADALRIPEGTVRSRLHYGLQALRATLDAERRGAE